MRGQLLSTKLIKIPVIDFAPFLNGDAGSRQVVAHQIAQACKEIGFMYLKNLGISSSFCDRSLPPPGLFLR